MIFRITLICCIAFIVSSCASTKGYPGPKLPKTELATIYALSPTKVNDATIMIRIEKADGLEVGSVTRDWPSYVEVLPGERSINAYVIVRTSGEALNKGLMAAALGPAAFGFSSGFAQDRRTSIKATVEKGKTYIIYIPDTSVDARNITFKLKEYVHIPRKDDEP